MAVANQFKIGIVGEFQLLFAFLSAVKMQDIALAIDNICIFHQAFIAYSRLIGIYGFAGEILQPYAFAMFPLFEIR